MTLECPVLDYSKSFVEISERDLLAAVEEPCGWEMLASSAPAQILRNELGPTSDVVSRFSLLKNMFNREKEHISKHTVMIYLKHFNYEPDHPEVLFTGG